MRVKNIKGYIFKYKELVFLFFVSFLYLSLLYFFSTYKFHYQEDEFITAFISFSLPPINTINWFSLVPDTGDWVAQFPVLYFAIQKVFIELLKPNIDTIRISTWPYQLISLIYIYLIGKEYFSEKKIQILMPLIYIFLAPNLYLSSLGLHFISSTAFFLAAFYYFLLIIKRGKIKYSVLCGIFMSLCYMTYASSYITFPFISLFILLESVKNKTLKFIKLYIISIIIFLILLSPFIIHALTVNNFFTQRIDQVTIFNSPEIQQQVVNGKNFILLFLNHTKLNIFSLFLDDIGGVNEYYFGHQALFNSITFILILIGIFVSLFKSLKNLFYLYPVIIVVSSFITGMLLTVPVGAFHRVYISFPFVAIIIAVAMQHVPKIKKYNHIVLGIFIFFVLYNLGSTERMISKDENISILTDSVYIEDYIKSNANLNTKLFVSSYPAYHLGKELLFRTNNSYPIESNYFESLLPKIGSNSILLLHYPTPEQINILKQKYPKGLYIDRMGNYAFKFHSIFNTKP